ncbi:MAG: arginine--tRNA ligase [Myxococcales bacterium]|nr:arginine--tRNA ligase [Myxococcales bacterium]USN51007.1 MAG: arginine--tRNA ligase [Myxococcales bacterium]
MLKAVIAKEFKKALEKLIVQKQLDSEQMLSLLPKMIVERPKNPAHGDFSCNIAMVLAKIAQCSPRELAATLSSFLKDSIFSKIEIAGPGFINLTLKENIMSFVVSEVTRQGKDYGTTKLDPSPKALVEFVSANPTGGLHLGHARGAFAGDALARMLSAAGYQVTKEYYVNDAGNQVEILGRTIHKRYRELFGESIEIESGEYPGSYVIDIAKALKERDGNKWLKLSEEQWLQPLVKFGVDYNLEVIKSTLAKLDIHMNSWFFEHTLHQGSALDDLIDSYDRRNMIYEANQAHGTSEKIRRDESKAAKYSHLQEGGWFLKTSLFGDEEDRIIKRKDGRFVYLTADLAYHHQKFVRGYDLIVDVFGGDHAGHIGRIKAGMEAMGHDISRLRFAIVQMVRLLKDGREVRFSKRAGEIVGIDDLLDSVGADVARFVFLMRALNSQFDLDLDVVTRQSQDNPVFYVQYGHARMATILKKAHEEKGISFDASLFDQQAMKHLSLSEERELLLKISELAHVVHDAALALEPHRLIYFCQDLVKSFHSYFTKYRHSEKIISDDPDKTFARLSLVSVVKQTIANALQFAGISAPEYMELTESDSDN